MLGIFYFAIGSGFVFLGYFFSVIIHEMAHSRMARLRGYTLRQIVLMPYGAVLKGGEDFPRIDSVLIAIAGPIVNLVIALFLIALWWLVPDIYSYTESLMWANLSLALFNILPIFPLDGARVVLALSKGRAKTLLHLRRFGIVFGIFLMLMMFVSIFYTFNISLGIMSIFVVHGAISGTEKELYEHIMSIDNFSKTLKDAILFCNIGMNEHMELYRFLEKVRPDTITTFSILDDSGKVIMRIGEEELRDILLHEDISTPFCKAILDTKFVDTRDDKTGEVVTQ